MVNANALKRYCQICDRWWGARAYTCPACGDKTVPRARLRARVSTGHEFVGGYTVDPSQPSTCQSRGRQKSEHKVTGS